MLDEIKAGFIMRLSVIVQFAVYGLVVFLLWNGLMPTIFGLNSINYFQAIGLIILCKILLGKVEIN